MNLRFMGVLSLRLFEAQAVHHAAVKIEPLFRFGDPEKDSLLRVASR